MLKLKLYSSELKEGGKCIVVMQILQYEHDSQKSTPIGLTRVENEIDVAELYSPVIMARDGRITHIVLPGSDKQWAGNRVSCIVLNREVELRRALDAINLYANQFNLNIVVECDEIQALGTDSFWK